MTIGYAITLAVSVGLLILYNTLVKKREFWLGLLFICTTVVNLGYFMLSVSKSVEFAIFANDVAYLGSVFLSTCMFLTILKLCGFTAKKRTAIILFLFGVIMFLIVATSGILPWYYKSVSIDNVNGATILIKEYGVLHLLYLVYLVAYFIAMISIITYSIIKKNVKTQKIAGFLAFIVFINIAVWFVEKYSDLNFELLSVSYLVSEILFIMLYWTIQDYVHNKDVLSYTLQEELALFGSIVNVPIEIKTKKAIGLLKEGQILAPRELEILERILQNKKRKEIANELMLSENTIKTYTRTLYSKLNVNSRNELYDLILKD